MFENELSEEIASYIEHEANTPLKDEHEFIERKMKEVEKLEAKLLIDPEDKEVFSKVDQAKNAIIVSHAKIASIRISEVKKWIANAALRANQICFVTHPIKYSHAYAQGRSVYDFNKTAESNDRYLCTKTLRSIDIDADGNAAVLDVAKFLLNKVGGKRLIEYLDSEDMSPFFGFSDDENELKAWFSGFIKVREQKELSSHKLAKQLYFPISSYSYHLISPLHSSLLSQSLYQRVTEFRYSDRTKFARKARKEGKFCPDILVEYPNLAVQAFGGTQPQNISLLNSVRGGKSFLLSCQPPAWGRRVLPPANHKNAFWREYDHRVWKMAKELKDYLIQILEKDSTKPRRDKRADLVDELIGLLLQYAAEVQSLTEHAGWSSESKLSLPEQLWLDPQRDDPEFQRLRDAKDWQQDIANQFASWLNHKLKDDKLVLKDVEYREWSSLVERKLARLKEDLEVLTS